MRLTRGWRRTRPPAGPLTRSNVSGQKAVMTREDRTIDSYAPIATAIATPAIQSRVGFGTFRKYHTLFERSHRLIARSSLLAPPESTSQPFWTVDPEFLHFAQRHGEYNHSHLFRYLTSPNAFDPKCIWALFWALTKSEHQFALKYLPFWSHEERLTGHFVSQICERIAEFAMHWSSLTGNDPKTSQLDVWYADTAAGNREKETGADLGLIVHGQYAGDDEFFKVARFQVKKVPSSNTARIDLSQTRVLLQSEGLGYYLFFHGQDRQDWRRPPSVAPASEFQYNLKKAEEALDEGKSPGRELGKEDIQSVDNKSFDFATFMTFAFADPAADFGAFARSKPAAVRILMGGGLPSRLAVISLGAPVQSTEWLHEMGEYIRMPRGDNE